MTTAKDTQGRNVKEDQTVEVLYQKLGDRWYAFSLIKDEVFMGSITQGELEAAGRKDESSPIDS